MLRGEGYPGLAKWVQCNHKSPHKNIRVRTREGEMTKAEVTVMQHKKQSRGHGWKIKKGAMSQGMQAAYRCWKRPGNRFSP